MSSPAPYYADAQVELYLGDSLDDALVGRWACGDALVSDVPYGIDYRSNARRQTLARSIAGDKDTRARDEVLSLWGERAALIFGTWRIPRPEGTRMLLVWDTKGALGMGDTKLPWKPAHQEVYVLGSGFRGHRGSDVLTFAPVQSLGFNGRLHPHEKPVPLMQALIEKCPPGVIVDPFAGVGSTLVAAKQCGRRAVGVEINEEHAEEAAKRLAQQSIFEPAEERERPVDLPGLWVEA